MGNEIELEQSDKLKQEGIYRNLAKGALIDILVTVAFTAVLGLFGIPKSAIGSARFVKIY